MINSKLMERIMEKAAKLGQQILIAVVILIIGAWLIKILRKILRKAMEKVQAEEGVIQFVDSFVKAALYVLLFFMMGSYFGIQTASIVALLGSAGVAIGLAVQGSLSNFAGGVLILLLKPFKVGDYILENGGKMEGTVSEITIFYTKLRTFDNKIVVLPNGNLANNSLVNVTSQETRRVDIPVSISYDSDIRLAKERLCEMLEKDKAILKDKERIVVVDELAASGINLIVRGWVKTEDYWQTKWRLTEQCKYTLDACGVTIPFPQLDVHLDAEKNQKTVAK